MEELSPKLVRLDTLMGGGTSDEVIIATCDAIKDFYPDMEFVELQKALRYGVTNVRWPGRMSFMAIAEFIRQYREAHKAYNPLG